MPLEHSTSKEAFKHNVETEIEAGKNQKQAVAIAFSEQRAASKDGNESAREIDANGWFEIKDNPLSRVGVFPYSGTTVCGDPSRIYNVYRPEEELSNPNTIDSFKLLPWIDDHPHVLLGDSYKGLTPAEKKGIHGVVGEEIYFKDGILYGNIKIFSETMADAISSGKKQLSAGYRCKYKLVSGVWNGIQYDAIQYDIQGNHLALVDEGRMGKEVSVLDKYTFDSIEITKEFEKMSKENHALDARLEKICTWAESRMAKDEAEEKEKKEKEAQDTLNRLNGLDEEGEKEKEKEGRDEEEKEEKKKEDKKEDGMDAAILRKEIDELKKNAFKKIATEVAARDSLASKLSKHVGTFDYSGMDSQEVAEYGIKKLEISCEKGSEKGVLEGFFHAKTASNTAFALDGNTTKTDNKLNGFLAKNSNV